MSDIGENICQAVDQIINSRISKVNFNSAQTCKVINADKAAQGIYTVSNQYTDFIAYSTDTTYKVDDIVYVLIPNNDMSEQKIIFSKKIIEENGQPITYTAPFNAINIIKSNIIKDTPTVSLLANGTTSFKDLWEGKVGNIAGYTKIGLQGLFQANLPMANEGEYGLQLELIKGSTIMATYYLSSKDMYGDPYQFNGYYQQQKVFDITDIGVFDKIKLRFYQNKNFLDVNNKLLPISDNLDNILPDNIFISSPQIVLGYDINDNSHSGLILYTEGDLNYGNDSSGKTLKWRLFRTRENKPFEIIESYGYLPNYKMYLYKYAPGARASQYQGQNWELVDNTNFLEYTFQPDLTKQEERYKCLLVFDGQVKYESNIIKFNNLNDVTAEIINKVINSLNLWCKDKTDGFYYLYNINNVISNASQANKKRSIVARFIDEKEQPQEADNVEKIQWILPRKNSMILVQPEDSMGVIELEEIEDFEGKYDNNVWEFLEKYKDNNEPDKIYHWLGYKDFYYVQYQKGDFNKSHIISYQIASNYNKAYNNNTIKCTIYNYGLPYIVKKDLVFGTMGMDADDCAFTITLSDNKTGIAFQESNNIIATADWYDSDKNKKEEWKENEITWSWLRVKTTPEDDDESQKDFWENKVFEIIKKEEGEELNHNQIYIKLNDELKNKDFDTLKEQYDIEQKDTDTDAEENLNTNYWYNYAILVAKTNIVTQEETQTYISYLPIGLYDQNECDIISGPTSIVYTENKQPIYDKNPYQLLRKVPEDNDKEEEEKDYDELKNISWSIKSTFDKKDTASTEETPKYKDDEYKPGLSSDNKLKPISIIIDGLKALYTVVATNENNKIIYEQPLIVYKKNLVNNLVENNNQIITIDEKDSIVSSFYSVGELTEDKNKNTVYSGLVIGDINSLSDDEKSKITPGIYGFKENKKTFAITQDGNAYFAGKIECSEGKIGGWTINDRFLSDNNGHLQLGIDNVDGQSGIKIGALTITASSFTLEGQNEETGQTYTFNFDEALKTTIENLSADMGTDPLSTESDSNIPKNNTIWGNIGNIKDRTYNKDTLWGNIGDNLDNNTSSTIWGNINNLKTQLNTHINNYEEQQINSLIQDNNGDIIINDIKYKLETKTVLVRKNT